MVEKKNAEPKFDHDHIRQPSVPTQTGASENNSRTSVIGGGTDNVND